MVLNLETIPHHLQVEIARRMDLDDFRNFEESSKHGNEVAKFSKPTKDVDFLEIDMTDINIINFKGEGIENRKECLWSVAKKQENCPRFNVIHRVIVPESITNARAIEIIKEVEKGNFVGQKVSLTLDSVDMEFDTFLRFLEAFNVDKLNIDEIDPHYLEHPIISKMAQIIHWYVGDETLLKLQCPNLIVTSSSTKINETLNQFLKDWFEKKRTIETFCIATEEEWNEKTILESLPSSLLWSPNTHEASALARISVDEAIKALGIHGIHIFAAKSFYSLNNGSENLFLAIYNGQLRIKKVSDANEELLDRMHPDAFRTLTGLCKRCKKSSCECS